MEKINLLAVLPILALQFFPHSLYLNSQMTKVFFKTLSKCLNSKFDVHSRLEFLIHSSKWHCFGTHV